MATKRAYVQTCIKCQIHTTKADTEEINHFIRHAARRIVAKAQKLAEEEAEAIGGGSGDMLDAEILEEAGKLLN